MKGHTDKRALTDDGNEGSECQQNVTLGGGGLALGASGATLAELFGTAALADGHIAA